MKRSSTDSARILSFMLLSEASSVEILPCTPLYLCEAGFAAILPVILLYEADFTAILPLILLYETAFGVVLPSIMLYEPHLAAILPLPLLYDAGVAAIPSLISSCECFHDAILPSVPLL